MYRVVKGEYSLVSGKTTESVGGSYTLEDIKKMISEKKKEVIEAGMKIRIDAPLILKWAEGDMWKYILMA